MVVCHLQQEKHPLYLKVSKLKKRGEMSSVNATMHTHIQEEAFDAQGDISCKALPACIAHPC